jgi:ribonucleoside-diphosphate reductase alpha chain
MRINKSEALYKYLAGKVSKALLEDEFFSPDTTAVLQMPIKSPEGSIFRSESPIELLERMKRFQLEWVAGGHKSGANKNNVSLTVSVKDNEWDIVRDWMWENKECYTGISVLPYDGGTYPQLPFEDTDEETYNKMMAELEHVKIDMRDIIEDMDTTDHGGESACAGGNCTVEAV